MTPRQIVKHVAEKYKPEIQQHARDDYAMTLILETALAEGISTALQQHLKEHPGRNLASAG